MVEFTSPKSHSVEISVRGFSHGITYSSQKHIHAKIAFIEVLSSWRGQKIGSKIIFSAYKKTCWKNCEKSSRRRLFHNVYLPFDWLVNNLSYVSTHPRLISGSLLGADQQFIFFLQYIYSNLFLFIQFKPMWRFGNKEGTRRCLYRFEERKVQYVGSCVRRCNCQKPCYMYGEFRATFKRRKRKN